MNKLSFFLFNKNSLKRETLNLVNKGDLLRLTLSQSYLNQQRYQEIEGIIIRKRNLQIYPSITIRRICSNVIINHTFLINAPNISDIKIIKAYMKKND
uniref:Ribosomal protein L19 n=1 Tax=Pterocladiophila hemisphaerica TaxID=2712948 RepID=A0A6M3WW90_9FLOR|nr:ribosomal protein L19 [Pterocladiophila hemisphaerica]